MTAIFWVEDQFHWVDKFKPILEQADFAMPQSNKQTAIHNRVEVHKFVESASQAINHSTNQPDIVILDADMNGDHDAGLNLSELIAEKWPTVPIIFLSEHSGTGIEEKVFEKAVPQDFIAKHQQNIEKVLCWRIKSLLRQRYLKQQNKAFSSDRITSGELTIDLATWNVYWFGERLMNPANSKRPLAPTPRKILRFLVEKSPRAISTGQMEVLLESEGFTYASYRQHIKTLRHAFEHASKTVNQASFLEYCQHGKGIVTFGDQSAYCWIN